MRKYFYKNLRTSVINSTMSSSSLIKYSNIKEFSILLHRNLYLCVLRSSEQADNSILHCRWTPCGGSCEQLLTSKAVLRQNNLFNFLILTFENDNIHKQRSIKNVNYILNAHQYWESPQKILSCLSQLIAKKITRADRRTDQVNYRV